MATAYSSNLALALPATGELSGTWGTTVNTQITNMLDEALGYQAFSATGGADTLTIPDGTTGVARSIYIQLNGTGGGSVAVPATKTKMYFVFNNTASAITFKVTGQTGVSIPAAAKMALVSNGTDIIIAQNYFAALTLGAALPVLSGGTGVTTSTGTGNNVLSASPTLTGTVAGASLSLSSLTSGRVTYAGTAGLLQDSANLLFNGTTLTANTIGAFTLAGTVAGGGNQLNNVIIGTTNPLAGAFTTLSASGSANNLATFNSTHANGLYVSWKTSGTDRAYIGSASSISTIGTIADTDIYAIGKLRFFGDNQVASYATVSSTGLAVTGTLSATGLLSNTSGVLQTGSMIARFENTGGVAVTGGAGAGLEVSRDGISAYNRTSSAYAPVNVTGSVITFNSGASATLNATLDSSGNLLVGVTTANANGGVLQLKSGITFPATAVAATDANTLDDYEEGTWTPVYEGLAGSIGATAGTASGSYTKIGRQVIANGQIILTNKGSWTSVVRIAGLPFTVGSAVPCAGPCTLGNVVYDGTNLVTYAIGASTNFYIDVSKPAVDRAVLSTTVVTNTSEFYFTVIYNI